MTTARTTSPIMPTMIDNAAAAAEPSDDGEGTTTSAAVAAEAARVAALHWKKVDRSRKFKASQRERRSF